MLKNTKPETMTSVLLEFIPDLPFIGGLMLMASKDLTVEFGTEEEEVGKSGRAVREESRDGVGIEAW